MSRSNQVDAVSLDSATVAQIRRDLEGIRDMLVQQDELIRDVAKAAESAMKLSQLVAYLARTLRRCHGEIETNLAQWEQVIPAPATTPAPDPRD
jgi:hypothetical protein